ncbi:MAG: BMP family ABC transporter substrate-binding protein, partial [Clostridia bacterium]|nr:BMP family ABC transporter substrate-binding protein [Clostridia bacterium]
MKKFFAMMLVLLMVLAALVGCGGNTNPAGNETENTEEPAENPGDATENPGDATEKPGDATEKPDLSGYKVAMITDYGDITDQSFNQT